MKNVLWYIAKKGGSKNRRSLWIIHNWFGKKIDFHILSMTMEYVSRIHKSILLSNNNKIIPNTCLQIYRSTSDIFFYHLPLFYFVNSKYIVGIAPFLSDFDIVLPPTYNVLLYDLIFLGLHICSLHFSYLNLSKK